MNKAMVIGYVGKDPELRYTPGGDAVANFSIASSERWTDKDGQKQERTEWHNCVVWRKGAELINRYVAKGHRIYVEGKLQTRSWEKDGVKRYSTEIVVEKFEFLQSKSDQTAGNQDSESPQQHHEQPAPAPTSQPIEDDLPF